MTLILERLIESVFILQIYFARKKYRERKIQLHRIDKIVGVIGVLLK